MLLLLSFAFVFVFGATVGSFVNVAVSRLPYEKSLLWPGSRCDHCLQPVRLYDNLPLVSYWVLRGRCRTCGTRFSVRYFLVELFTALAFTGLFYLVVVCNVRELPFLRHEGYELALLFDPLGVWAVFSHHADLLTFLLI